MGTLLIFKFFTLLQIRKILTNNSQIKFQVFNTMTLSSMKAAGLLALTFCATCLSAVRVKVSDLPGGLNALSNINMKDATLYDVRTFDFGGHTAHTTDSTVEFQVVGVKE